MRQASTSGSGAGQPPRVLLAASTWWPVSARMAMAMAHCGFEVFALVPPGHPAHYVKCIKKVYRLTALHPQTSMRQAIKDCGPDLIVPCDDRVVLQLHQIHDLYPEFRPLIEYSLGDPKSYSVVDSRQGLMDLAAKLGIRCPRTAAVASEKQAREMFARFAPAAVMKVDGTFGGDGVRVIRSAEEAAEAFRALRSATGLMPAIKLWLVYRDPLALWTFRRRDQFKITMQEFIEGFPANNMLCSWQGAILDEVSAVPVACKGLTGAATIVRLTDNPEMSQVAGRIARRLGVSGFFGLDFIIEHRSGDAYLIEMNPRCTQLGHLQSSDRGDLASVLCEQVSGQHRSMQGQPILGNTIAFFPQAWRGSEPGDGWFSSHQDIPWEEARLVEELLLDPWPERQWAGRAYRWMGRLVHGLASKRSATVRTLARADARREDIVEARAPVRPPGAPGV